MYQNISNLMEQIKQYEHLHKITIFNRSKNKLNMHAHNIAEGKLIELFKSFPYFNNLNQNLGGQYLQNAIKFIKPYILRLQQVLVNAQQNNVPAQYLLVQGVLSIYDFKSDNKVKPKNPFDKNLVFRKYLSNGSYINFSQYRQKQCQLVAHQICKMIRLPSRLELDPIQWSKKNAQHSRLSQRNVLINQIKNAVAQCIYQQAKHKNNQQLSPTYGLGTFDFNDLLKKSSIQMIPNHKKILSAQALIDRIGLIISGKVIQQNKKTKVHKFVSYDNAILTLYKKNYNSQSNKIQKNQSFMEFGEWIGLEEYLRSIEVNPFRIQNLAESDQKDTDSVVKQLQIRTMRQYRTAEDCQILWIPIFFFAKKFNYQLDFGILDQWRAMIDLKEEIKVKTDKIQQKLQFQKKQRQPFANQLPIISTKQQTLKLKSLGHNVKQLQRQTQFKRNKIFTKQKKFGPLKIKRSINISQTSLLGITMRRDFTGNQNDNKLYQDDLKKHDYKIYSHFSKSTLGKKSQQNQKNKAVKTNLKSNHDDLNIKRRRKNISLSNYNIETDLKFNVDDSPQDLIMYPQAYQSGNLSPDLRKQLFLASKACNIQVTQQQPVPSAKHQSMCLQNSRAYSIQNGQSVNRKLSPIGSKQSLTDINSNPQLIYKNMMQRISFKYPNLSQKIRLQKEYKKRSKQFDKLSIKQRIQTLRILEQIHKKQLKRQRLDKINQYIAGMNKNKLDKSIEIESPEHSKMQ